MCALEVRKNNELIYRSLSITDRVVKMMEKYAEDLENKVAKKTMQVLGRLKKLVPNRTIQLHKHTPKWNLKR